MISKKPKKIHKNIILVLLSTSITFFILVISYEIFENIRYARFKAFYRVKGDLYGNLTVASPNTDLIWEYKAYGECTSKRREYNGRLVGKIKTNRYGFRDYDYEHSDRPNEIFRIAFIGDSVTLGLWVDEDKTFVRRFEIEANKIYNGRKVQTLNFGVDGYNTAQIYEMVKVKVLKFSPNKAVYMMCLNDFDNHEAAGNKILYFRKPKFFLGKRIKMAITHANRSEKNDYHFFHFKRNKEIVFHKILEMSQRLANRGINFLVVIVPVFEFAAKDSNEYKYLAIHRQIEGYLRKNKIPVFDLLSVFKKQTENLEDFFYDVWHPNEEGHQLIAKALLEPVLSEYVNSR